MRRDELTCTRCGHVGTEGVDVRFRLASLESEAEEVGERRLGSVTVALPVDEWRNGPRGLEYAEVPERYSTEVRCIDRDACRDRVATARRPAAVEDEEVAPWL